VLQLSEKVFVAGALLQVVAYAVLVVSCWRHRAHPWGRLGLLAGALGLTATVGYLGAVTATEVTGDAAWVQALSAPVAKIARVGLTTTATVTVVAAVVLGRRRR
jgi:hypothetical protein